MLMNDKKKRFNITAEPPQKTCSKQHNKQHSALHWQTVWVTGGKQMFLHVYLFLQIHCIRYVSGNIIDLFSTMESVQQTFHFSAIRVTVFTNTC